MAQPDVLEIRYGTGQFRFSNDFEIRSDRSGTVISLALNPVRSSLLSCLGIGIGQCVSLLYHLAELASLYDL